MSENVYPRFNPHGKIIEVTVVVSSASKVEVLVVNFVRATK